MKFISTPLPDVFLIEPELIEDERGFFARTFCDREFARHGLNPHLSQCSVSYNPRAGTLRGMHWQAQPHAEAKLIHCTQGAIYDVALDLRPYSPTFKRWFATELSAKNHRLFYIPEGCAHGFQTLTEDCEVCYQISAPYVPEAARGVRWDDPAFGIEWPTATRRILSARDSAYPAFTTPLNQ